MTPRPEHTLVLNRDFLAARRRELGQPPEWVAYKAGITASSVQAYERGARQPGLTVLVALAAALQCRVADLILEPAAADDAAAIPA